MFHLSRENLPIPPMSPIEYPSISRLRSCHRQPGNYYSVHSCRMCYSTSNFRVAHHPPIGQNLSARIGHGAVQFSCTALISRSHLRLI